MLRSHRSYLVLSVATRFPSPQYLRSYRSATAHMPRIGQTRGRRDRRKARGTDATQFGVLESTCAMAQWEDLEGQCAPLIAKLDAMMR